MKLTSAQVERTLGQFEARAIPDDHPVIPQLNDLFGEQPASHYACQSPLNKIVLSLRRACGVIFERVSAEEHRHQRTGAGQYTRLPSWCWRSLHRAQASGADRRRVCPATGDIPALA
jgi:hypothetical protein